KRLVIVLFICFCIVLTGCSGNKKDYAEDLQTVTSVILGNSAEVEDILNQYAKVWRFTIKSRVAIEVSNMMSQSGLDKEHMEKHITVNTLGNIPDDFSMNIDSMSSYFEDTGILDEIRDTAKEVKEEVSKLNNPPTEYEKAYDELLDLYTYSEEYTSMALKP